MSDLDIYKAQGFAGTMGLGRAPALLVVDFVEGFTDPAHFGGGNIRDAIAKTVPLLALARENGLPDAHTRVEYEPVILCGNSTSGCVRASVVDACSHNFRTVLVTDCVGDRAIGPHEANIFDMGQKYADLSTSDALIAALRGRKAA